jgi:ABC-type proline/glycine betaine transport system permease subunit
VQYGYVIGAPFYFLYQLVFKAHIAEFLFGVTLGWMYLRAPKDKNTLTRFINSFGATAAAAILILLFSCVDIKSVPFMYILSANGLLAPVYGLLIWSLANGEDLLLSGVLSSSIFRFLGKISYEVYIFQACVFQFCQKSGYGNLFIPILVAFSVVAHLYIEVPVGEVIASFSYRVTTTTRPAFFSFSAVVRRVFDFISKPNHPALAVLAVYYTVMFSVIVGYFLTMYYKLEGGSSVAKLQTSSSVYFDGMKWSVLIGVPAVLCTLAVSDVLSVAFRL